MHVTGHGCAELTGCSADGNWDGSYHLALGAKPSSRLDDGRMVLTACTWPPSQPPSPAAQVG